MDTRRMEIAFWDSGAVIYLLSHHLGGLSPTEFAHYWAADSPSSRTRYKRALMQDGILMAPELYQDDGFVLRIVTGPLTSQERTEWKARAQGRLNLPDGRLIVGSAFDWLGDSDWPTKQYPHLGQAIHGGLYETTTCVHLKPGLYQATLYSYLPNDLSVYEADKDSAYYRELCQRTRPSEPFPDWLADDDSEQEYVNFVLHIVAVDQQTFEALQPHTPQDMSGWEWRSLDTCPLGLATDTLFITQADYEEIED